MNLLDIAQPAIDNVVPNTAITLQIFGKTTMSDAGKPNSTYTTITGLNANIQPMSSQKLEHKDYYNQNGIYKRFYLNSNTLTGLNRNLSTAGDYIITGGLYYKIVEVVEPYNTGWIMVIGCQSTDNVTG